MSFLDNIGQFLTKRVAPAVQQTENTLAPRVGNAFTAAVPLARGFAMPKLPQQPIQKTMANFRPLQAAANLTPAGDFLNATGIANKFPNVANIARTLQQQNQSIKNISQGSRNPQDFSEILNQVSNVGGGSEDVNKAISFLRNKLRPEDVRLIGAFAEHVETKGPKATLPKEIGQPIQSLAENVFGSKAATWGNQKLKNVFDQVLGKIGEGKNKAGLGLSVGNIRGNEFTPPTKQEQSSINDFENMLKSNETTPVAEGQAQSKKAEAHIALGQEALGKKGNAFNRIKGLPNDFQNSFQNWVNSRKATDLQGQIAKKPFTQLDNQGIDALLKFQSGEKSGVFGQVQQYFDNKFKQLQQSGLQLGYRQDYLPQLWQNSEKEVMDKLGGRTLTTKPSFTLERIIKDYKEGIAKGLTPKFTKLSDLVGWYESYANKAVADRSFFKGLLQQGYIQPSSQAEQGWVTLDPDHFPKYLSQTGAGKYMGTYKAPPEVAQVINGYLRQPPSEISGAAKALTTAKNITLSSGIPKTAINTHGLNILVRNTLASNNPVGAFAKGIAWMINPNAAQKSLEQNLGKAEFFVRHGLSIATEDSAYTKIQPKLEGNILQKGRDYAMNLQRDLFHDALFKKYIPALKLNYADQVFQDLKKSYPEEQAAKLASKTANDFFGGVNVDELGRSQTMQNLMRTIILAPDWAETNIRTGAGILKGITNPTSPEYKAYRTFARNLVMAYVGANILNKTLSGHWMYQNSSGSEFGIETGTSTPDGKQRSIPVFGTAADFARIPYQVAMGIAKGDPTPIFQTIRNRLSTPLAAGVGLLTNTDYLGRKIYGPQMTPVQNAVSIGGQAAGAAGIAPPGQAAIDLATGRSNPEQAVTQSLQLPVHYSKGQSTSSAAFQTAYNQAKQAGKSDLAANFAALAAYKKAGGGSTKPKKGRKVKGFKVKKFKVKKPKRLKHKAL